LASNSNTVITLNAIAGCEYRINGNAWQVSTEFTGLTPDTDYEFEARKAETDTHSASPASEKATFKTTNVGIEHISQSNALTAWCQNSMLHVSGLVSGEQWSVYNISGVLVHESKAKSEKASVKLPSSGIYIVKQGNKTVKVIF
jgi:hypothetical protein